MKAAKKHRWTEAELLWVKLRDVLLYLKACGGLELARVRTEVQAAADDYQKYLADKGVSVP